MIGERIFETGDEECGMALNPVLIRKKGLVLRTHGYTQQQTNAKLLVSHQSCELPEIIKFTTFPN